MGKVRVLVALAALGSGVFALYRYLDNPRRDAPLLDAPTSSRTTTLTQTVPALPTDAALGVVPPSEPVAVFPEFDASVGPRPVQNAELRDSKWAPVVEEKLRTALGPYTKYLKSIEISCETTTCKVAASAEDPRSLGKLVAGIERFAATGSGGERPENVVVGAPVSVEGVISQQIIFVYRR